MEAFAALGNGAGASAFIGRRGTRAVSLERKMRAGGRGVAWARGEERNDVVSLTCWTSDATILVACSGVH